MATRCLCCMKEIDASVCPHCGYPMNSQNEEHQLPVGTVLRDRYQIGKVLGQGGFGITYLAWDSLMQQCVAVKEFYPNGTVYRKSSHSTLVECVSRNAVTHYEYSKERFLREARALVQFREIPEIVDLLDFVKENNTAYIVMEYVKGVDLAKYIQRKGGKLSVDETFRLLRPVMEALAKVHRGGIVHRDISPDNIILDPMGGAKLLDFGAVRAVENPDVDQGLASSTEAILKHGFAPLEQYNSRGSLGPWTDEYALCATVWYCLTGQVPENAAIRMSEGIDPDWSSIPELPEHQQKALQKGFSCRAKDRYADVYGLMEALFPAAQDCAAAKQNDPAASADEPADTEKTTPAKKQAAAPKKKHRSSGKILPAAVLAAIFLALGVALFLANREPNRYERAVALMEKENYSRAASIFESLGSYRDSAKRAAQCHNIVRYAQAEELMEQGSYLDAKVCFEELGDYMDSAQKAQLCDTALRYEEAQMLMQQGCYPQAAEIFESLGNYQDSAQKALLCHNAQSYAEAELLMQQYRFREAAAIFEALGDYRDSADKVIECSTVPYNMAQEYLEAGDLYQAATFFYRAGDYQDAWDRSFATWALLNPPETLSTGYRRITGLYNDGTAVAAGYNAYGNCEVSDWTDMVALSSDFYYTLGLKADGTVLAIGFRQDIQYQRQVHSWTDIAAISVGSNHFVGLKKDGTVVAVGLNVNGQLAAVGDWTDIVAISAGGSHTVGLRADGTVVAVGATTGGRCNVSEWTDIIAISAGRNHTVGLRADGTVVVAGLNTKQEDAISRWTDIVAISAATYHTLGLRADGTVVAVGDNEYGQCDVSGWENIVAISAGTDISAGLRADGTVVVAGDYDEERYDLSSWENIRVPD